MSKKSRRRLLQGLALTLPAAWSRPVVESIILPAHAQTSPACSAPAGCYEAIAVGGEDAEGSFTWPGGVGPFTVDVFDNSSCDGDADDTAQIVVAENAEEAAELLPCDDPDEIETDPPLVGCAFFLCPSMVMGP